MAAFEELHHLAAPQLLPNDNLLGRIDAVDLEHVLGDIQPDPCGRLPDVIRCNDHPKAIRRRERAPSTTSEAVIPPSASPQGRCSLMVELPGMCRSPYFERQR